VISVVIVAICGAIAAVLAMVSAGGFAGNRSRFGIVFGVCLVLLYGSARLFVQPHAEARYNMWEVDKTLAKNPAFAALKQYDTPTYRDILNDLNVLLRQGKSQQEVFASVRGIIEPLVIKRIPEASDAAAARYMTVLLQEMKELYGQGGELCYSFLFPAKGAPMDIQKHISPATRSEDFAALAELLRSASVSPQAPPLASEAEPLLQPTVEAIAERYGRDLLMLQTPGAPGVDKSRLCEMTINLYGRILKLPPEQSGKVIRHMLRKA
jgi:hypothetical protein